MLNRALIVAIISVSLGIVGIMGYAYGTHNRPPSVPAGILTNADGEQQPPKAPEVFETYVEAVMQAWMLDISGDKAKIVDLREAGALKFPLVAGNRVEGEVIASKGSGNIFGMVRDPYGNIILENKEKKYPWRFALVAITTGEYSLEVNTGSNIVFNIGGAHLKVTVYDK